MIAILRRAVAWLIGLLIVAAPAHAAIITVEFAGTISDTNILGIAGSSFNGSFTLDGTSVTGATLAIGPFSSGPVVPTGFIFEVMDGPPDPDSILIGVTLAGGVSWPGAGNVTSWSVELKDEDAMVFPPTFPPSLPKFEEWSSTRFELIRDDTCGVNEGCFAGGPLSSFQTVPEPASLPLLVAALGIGLWFARRGRGARGRV